MDLRSNKLKHKQWLKDWETPMWLFVVLDTFCLCLSPLARADFAMSANAIKQGRWITVFSAFFMHESSGHLISDMIMLIALSVILDSVPISRTITMLMYLIGGIVCNLLILPIIFHTHMLVMGSSGGAATLDGMAVVLVGATLLRLWIRKQKLIKIDSNHIYGYYGWKFLIAIMITLALLDSNLYQVSPDAFYLHLFGLILGAISGLFIYRTLDF